MLKQAPNRLVVSAFIEREEPNAAFKDRIKFQLTIENKECDEGVVRYVDLEVTINNGQPLIDLLKTLLT